MLYYYNQSSNSGRHMVAKATGGSPLPSWTVKILILLIVIKYLMCNNLQHNFHPHLLVDQFITATERVSKHASDESATTSSNLKKKQHFQKSKLKTIFIFYDIIQSLESVADTRGKKNISPRSLVTRSHGYPWMLIFSYLIRLFTRLKIFSNFENIYINNY